MSSRFRNSDGFTLIEVLIAFFILALISIAASRATTNAIRLRDILANEGSFFSAIRLTMDIMQRDISLIYSPTIMVPKPAKSGTGATDLSQPPTQDDDGEVTATPGSPEFQALMGDAGRTSEFWAPAVDKTGIRPARFQGDDKKMSFIAASHIRIYKDSPESDFAKITYELGSGRQKDDGIPPGVLVKTESPNAFTDEEDKDGRKKTYNLVRGLKRLRFRYWNQKMERFENKWDSDHEDTKNRFPDYIEVFVEVVGPKQLSFEGTYRFRPEVPVNGVNPSF